VLRQLQARDVLKQVFTLYRGEIVDKAYHQLRTTDHVSRFRPSVLEALVQLSSEQQVLQIAQSLRASGLAPSVEAACWARSARFATSSSSWIGCCPGWRTSALRS